MAYKILCILIIFIFTNTFSNIIYDKNEISVTDFEVNSYIKLYEENYGSALEINKAIKDLVLIKKTIKFLFINNPKFMEILDNNIKQEIREEELKNQVVLDFYRFLKIRNEFISEYFINKFSKDQLISIFSSLKDMNLPLSRNKCLTVEKLHKINEDKKFIVNFYENLKTNKKDFKTEINNEIFDVCINSETFKFLESAIVKHIEYKTEEDFNKFIYGKIN